MKNKDDALTTSKDVRLYTTMQLNVVTGVCTQEDNEKILLQYPAVVSQNSTGTGYVFSPFPLVDGPEQFTLHKAALLGSTKMPGIMAPAFLAYVKRRTEEK